MRGDLMFLVSLLSIASATILYIGSDNSYKYIYGTTESLKRRMRDRLHDVAPKCCDQLTKECFACATGLLVQDFCKRHSGEYGCPEQNRYAYVFVSYGDPTPAIKASKRCTALVGKNIDVVIARLGKPIPTLPDGVQQRMVDYPKTKGRYQWKWAYAKFYPALWYEYDATLVMDTDNVMLKSLNHLLDDPPPRGMIYAPRAYWLNDTYCTSLMVYSPQRNHSSDALIRKVLETRQATTDSDMDWYNKYMKPFSVEIGSEYTMLTGEFDSNDRIYRYHAKRWNATMDETLGRAPVVHAIAKWKPWTSVGRAKYKSKQLQHLLNLWSAI
jgi:hypothetical protein